MIIIDVDTQREYFMECVYDILSDDETNDRANQIIDLFDSLCTDNESTEREKSGGWIKCSERMPDTVKVWGCVKFSDEVGNSFYQEEIVFYEKTGRFVNQFNYPVPVVAWQPLPEPYKESEEDTE